MTLAFPRRRRLYLMRHGSVDYFLPDGTPLPPDAVPLNERGRAQADAAGELFGLSGVHFDRVIVSGLPRTVETATRVLGAAHQSRALVHEPTLQEIRPGRLADIPQADLVASFLGAFAGVTHESARFLGGESIGEMLDRAVPAFRRIVADPDWNTLLLVLHGGINRALLSYALTGERFFLGRLEQSPACVNVIDAGERDFVVRAINLAPTQWLHAKERFTTMEKLLGEYLRLDLAADTTDTDAAA